VLHIVLLFFFSIYIVFCTVGQLIDLTVSRLV